MVQACVLLYKTKLLEYMYHCVSWTKDLCHAYFMEKRSHMIAKQQF